MPDYIISLHLVLAVVGGVIGGVRAAAAKPNRNIVTKTTDIMAGVAAAASSSHYVPITLPWLALVYGMVAGVAAGYLLDIVYNLVPRVVQLLASLKLGVTIDDDDVKGK